MNSAPEILKTCLDFLQSDAFFLVLSNITGLKLHELASCSDSDGETSENNQNNGKENLLWREVYNYIFVSLIENLLEKEVYNYIFVSLIESVKKILSF